MSDNPGSTGMVQGPALERAARAYRLRVAGLGWDAIAEVCGYSDKSAAHHAVRRQFDSLPQPSRELARQVLRDRTETLWIESLKDVMARKPGAVRAAVAVLQRAAALDGLDAPTSVALYSPTSEQIEAIVARLVDLDRGDQPVQVEAEIIDAGTVDP